MWRQFLVICLLITVSNFWSVVEAKIEEEFDFENNIDNSLNRNHFEEQRQVDTNGKVQDDIAEGLDGIQKDVQEPGLDQEAPVAPDTGVDQDGSVDMDKTTHIPPTAQHLQSNSHNKQKTEQGMFAGPDIIFIVTVAACSVAGLVGIIMAGVCWYKLNRSAKAASDVEYPAYGVTGPNKERIPSPGDRKLAQSAQMYHYQHQKQQMIAMEKANGEMKHDASDEESEEENEEGDYTVYECPGLAPTGEMEVKNPLFSDETPVTPNAGEDSKEGNE